MKKYILFSVAAMILASCSNNNEDVAINNVKVLTPATLSLSTENDTQTTRAIWSVPANGSITVAFENNDNLLASEYGLNNRLHFSNVDNGYNFQSGNFSGSWESTKVDEKTGRTVWDDSNNWAAVLPYSDSNSISMAADHVNTFTLTMPTSQTSFVTTFKDDNDNESYASSPDRAANIMIAAKNSERTSSGFLAPVCAYLTFYTDNTLSNVDVISISGTDHAASPIAGTLTLTTSGQWDTWANFESAVDKSTAVISNEQHTIYAHGQHVNRTINNVSTQVYEYVVCIFPGDHILQFKNHDTGTILGTTDLLETEACHRYNLGKLD